MDILNKTKRKELLAKVKQVVVAEGGKVAASKKLEITNVTLNTFLSGGRLYDKTLRRLCKRFGIIVAEKGEKVSATKAKKASKAKTARKPSAKIKAAAKAKKPKKARKAIKRKAAPPPASEATAPSLPPAA